MFRLFLKSSVPVPEVALAYCISGLWFRFAFQLCVCHRSPAFSPHTSLGATWTGTFNKTWTLTQLYETLETSGARLPRLKRHRLQLWLSLNSCGTLGKLRSQDPSILNYEMEILITVVYEKAKFSSFGSWWIIIYSFPLGAFIVITEVGAVLGGQTVGFIYARQMFYP